MEEDEGSVSASTGTLNGTSFIDSKENTENENLANSSNKQASNINSVQNPQEIISLPNENDGNSESKNEDDTFDNVPLDNPETQSENLANEAAKQIADSLLGPTENKDENQTKTNQQNPQIINPQNDSPNPQNKASDIPNNQNEESNPEVPPHETALNTDDKTENNIQENITDDDHNKENIAEDMPALDNDLSKQIESMTNRIFCDDQNGEAHSGPVSTRSDGKITKDIQQTVSHSQKDIDIITMQAGQTNGHFRGHSSVISSTFSESSFSERSVKELAEMSSSSHPVQELEKENQLAFRKEKTELGSQSSFKSLDDSNQSIENNKNQSQYQNKQESLNSPNQSPKSKPLLVTSPIVSTSKDKTKTNKSNSTNKNKRNTRSSYSKSRTAGNATFLMPTGGMFVEDPATPRHESELRSFTNRGTVPPLYDRPGLMQYIQRLSIDSVMNGDYGAADKYQQLNKKFYDRCIETENQEKMEKDLQVINEQINTVKNQLSECKEKWKNIINDARNEEKVKLDELKEKQERELDEYDMKWQDEATLRPFTKQSPQLLEIRTKEKKMLLTKMFNDAENTKKYAEMCEKDEKLKQQEIAEREAIFGRIQIMKRHQIEQVQLLQKAEQKIANLEKKRDEEIHVIEIRFVKIEYQKSKIGKSNKWADAELAVKMRSRTSDASGMLSPRSQLKMDQYRKKSTVSRLVLKPITKFPKVNLRAIRTPTKTSRSGK